MRMILRASLTVLLYTTIHLLLQSPFSLSVHAESAILINADTGTILFEKKARTLHYPASITKVATALYALLQAKDQLDTIITADQDAIASITEEAQRRSHYTVPAHWLIPGGTHMGIKRGEQLSMRTLLYGMMIVSANDAANVIAQHIGGTIPNFVAK